MLESAAPCWTAIKNVLCCGLGWLAPAMTTIILVAALSFVGGVLAAGAALLAFVVWATKDTQQIDREYRERKKE
jgi:hypothetical protein